MRIAQVAPLSESVPPQRYGGTERVVHWLTEELVRLGHDVTLFATADSNTSARLVPLVPHALRGDAGCTDPSVYEIIQIERVLRDAHKFDVIHFHNGHVHLPASRRLPTPSVTTLHGRLDLPELVPLYSEFSDAPVVSISDAQRTPLPMCNWQGTVHHGLPPDRFRPDPPRAAHDERGYFAFLGRISPEKRVDHAIAIAERTGTPLRIAAKVDAADRGYFESVIRPLLDSPLIDFLGEVDDDGKHRLLAGAKALLFPIDWPEPFGLVMIEAMACGTPVVARRRGSVPEVMEHGVTGFIVDGLEDAVEAASRAHEIDRRGCRDCFERRFTARRMAEDYERVYRRLALGGHAWPAHPVPSTLAEPLTGIADAI